ncbi:hypothetical protein H0A36_02215 [Endozoicomonas sp. SM1973]|uniref:Uncharacterized protein n=1 Tax=Spartinivicinus marinus TaxID=2994442 RepID=A0A853HU51_9GAMM|nr:hypothetical protein [Spartinivicinus marinus]MCX4029953.1 hypothetical protein [Spartinivicinus marinus]NYZ64803.1 hypothetical protein [Spartinivicinus marinus]
MSQIKKIVNSQLTVWLRLVGKVGKKVGSALIAYLPAGQRQQTMIRGP